ncbi:iron ABC transporter permease [Salinadaptatus halalkaliphilus]|uniref:Cobalamin import system permease protein BtuC n=1 Tax=Salinadaptatus halalkaliphilus TaxID=2419781 RepID=A0A4S3TQJ8_9EURY|nr:iron ABC transporter permease [Salinadaptatus halalkaliphilus]THE66674.1 iron ABC transporter permease [Salinadaptatus halalkaliphilus]
MSRSRAVDVDTSRSGRDGWLTGTLAAFCLVSVLVTVVAGFVQVRFGAYSMTRSEAWAGVTDPAVVLEPAVWLAFVLGGELPELSQHTIVVWDMRLPRVLVAAIAGATLAVSGAIFQAVTRNELASPFVLGVSSGAGFAVLATLVVFGGLAPFLPLFAALGGTLAFVIVYVIAWKGGTSPVRLVLAGVIVNMVFQSLQQGLFFFVDDIGVAQTAISWLTGSLTGTGWDEVRIASLPAVVAITIAIAGARQLNVLLLGEDTARALGMRVERTRLLLSSVAILAASAAIAVAGIVSFFGLVVPHIVRTVVGSDYRQLIVGCLFAGPALLVTADVGARLALSGTQLPVGVVTGLIGGPYFLYLMRTRQSMGEI